MNVNEEAYRIAKQVEQAQEIERDLAWAKQVEQAQEIERDLAWSRAFERMLGPRVLDIY